MKKKNRKRTRNNQRKKNKGKKGSGKKPGKKGRKTAPERRFRQSCTLTSANVTTFKKIRNFLSQQKRFEKVLQLLQKKANTTIFAETAITLGKLTNNGTSTSEDANLAYTILTNCSTSVTKFCSSENLTLNASKCLKQFPAFEEYMECQKDKSLDECGAQTIEGDCKNITAASKNANKVKKQCLSPDIVGSFAYCMKFIKSGLVDAVGDITCTTIPPSATPTFTTIVTSSMETTSTTATTGAPPSSTTSATTPTTSPVTCQPPPPSQCSSKLYCADEAAYKKANNYRNQACGIQTNYKVLSEKLDQLNVFMEYFQSSRQAYSKRH